MHNEPAAAPGPDNSRRPLPRAPVLDWSSFASERAPTEHSIERLPHRLFTSSGRAAIYQALQQLALPAHSVILVPTYHCPTMVAPVVLAGLQPVYYGIREDALPDLAGIAAEDVARAKVILVPQLFGLPQSLAEVRAWCDQHAIALIEDCAHSFFGDAGERSVGAWGDFATASLSKFLPVPDAGLLASAHRPIRPAGLQRAGLKAQLKCFVDILEFAATYERLAGLRGLLGLLFRAKNASRTPPAAMHAADEAAPAAASSEAMMQVSNMGRVQERPLAGSKLLHAALPRGRIVAQRQRNYRQYADELAGLAGCHLLRADPGPTSAPYVFPLWVDDSDRIYHAMRAQGLPVFRWDRIWPGTPALPGDQGPLWSRHLLQLLCHQDLSTADVQRTARTIRDLLRAH